MNVSSIVVQTRPEFMTEVIENLKKVQTCDVHFEDPSGKIIVTVEGSGVEEEIKHLNAIKAIPRIIAADMMYSYSEEELEANMEQLKGGNVVPKVLEEDLPPHMIKYGGDVRNFVDDRPKKKQ